MAITRSCTESGKSFTCSNEDQAYYEMLGVPIPTLCPEERQRRRLAWRKERVLHARKCSATGQRILSIYGPESPFPVYENDYWYSDQWDPAAYGRDFDFTRPFFEQFNELQNQVPHRALNVVKPSLENSDYCNQVTSAKNCYLIFDSRFSEKCLYGKSMERSFDCMDCYKILGCEACYEVIHAKNCHFCMYIQSCEDCFDCKYSANLIGCSYCFGCTNLRNKQYYFFNKKLSKDEWQKRVNECSKNANSQELLEHFESFRQEQPIRYTEQTNCEDCSGDYLIHCKNCHDCFDCECFENSAYCYDTTARNSEPNSYNYDINYFGTTANYCYESVGIGNTVTRVQFCENVWSSSDVYYSRISPNSQYLFGCVGMRGGKYAILNKPYEKNDYLRLKERIIAHMKVTGEWGEFFPIKYSPFAYNDTLAQESSPLNREEVLARGWNWSEQQNNGNSGKEQGLAPSAISGLGDDLLNQTFVCERSGKLFRIVKLELEFYRKMALRLPRYCPEERLQARMSRVHARHLSQHTCDNCKKMVETTCAPNVSKLILCEKCYLDSVD